MLNALSSSKSSWNDGRKAIRLKVIHSFAKCIRVSNACNPDFRLFFVLGDELLIHCIYLNLYLGYV